MSEEKALVSFYGQAYHKVSPKNQVALPKQILNTLAKAEEGQVLLMRLHGEKILRIYTQKQTDRIVGEIRRREDLGEAEKMELIRHIAGSAEVIEPDVQGRFVLPSEWVSALGLQDEVCFFGAFSHIEIWPAGMRREWEAREKDAMTGLVSKVTGILNM